MAIRDMGFAAWIYDDVTLDTLGVTRLHLEYDTVEHADGATGSTPVDVFFTGVRLSVRGALALSQANLQRVAGVFAATTTTGYLGAGGETAQVRGSALARRLVVHPLGAAGTQDDVTIHKAVLLPDGPITYGAGADDARIPVRALALYDPAQPNLQRLFALGGG